MARSGVLVLLLMLSSIAAANATLVVDSVNSGSPAESCGLKAGDRILQLDGRGIDNLDDLQAVMASHRPGDSVTKPRLGVWPGSKIPTASNLCSKSSISSCPTTTERPAPASAVTHAGFCCPT